MHFLFRVLRKTRFKAELNDKPLSAQWAWQKGQVEFKGSLGQSRGSRISLEKIMSRFVSLLNFEIDYLYFEQKSKKGASGVWETDSLADNLGAEPSNLIQTKRYKLNKTNLILLVSVLSLSSYAKDKELKVHINNRVSNFFKGAKEEHVTFYSRENVSSPQKIARKGVVIKRPNAKATILICPGFMCDKFDVSFLHFLFNNCNTMAFDFRAHGENIDGQYCTLGREESYDVIAAAEFVKNHQDLKNKPLIAYGFSMGACAAIVAQAQDKNLFNAMILDCPFDSTDKLLERGISQFKINVFGYEMGLPGSTLLKNYAYSPYVQSLLKVMLKAFTKMDSTAVDTNFCPVYPEEAIKYISVPCYIISCINDEKAPLEAVSSVYDGAAGFKRMWVAEGRRHFDPIFYAMPEYVFRVNEFIDYCIDGSFQRKKQQKIIGKKEEKSDPIIKNEEEKINIPLNFNKTISLASLKVKNTQLWPLNSNMLMNSTMQFKNRSMQPLLPNQEQQTIYRRASMHDKVGDVSVYLAMSTDESAI